MKAVSTLVVLMIPLSALAPASAADWQPTPGGVWSVVSGDAFPPLGSTDDEYVEDISLRHPRSVNRLHLRAACKNVRVQVLVTAAHAAPLSKLPVRLTLKSVGEEPVSRRVSTLTSPVTLKIKTTYGGVVTFVVVTRDRDSVLKVADRRLLMHLDSKCR